MSTVLQIQENPAETSVETVCKALASREMLLVLDNFEHLLEAAGCVSELLHSCASLKVLVTSQAPLHVSWEFRYPVSPLAVPEATDLGHPELLATYDSVRLFMHRARAVNATLSLAPSDMTVVGELCRRLDGLPLAIELAAARLSMFAPKALLDRLSSRLDLLASTARDVPERQRAIRVAMDWSVSLLNPRERLLFARLSVFEGGATLEAVERVCGGEETSADVLDDLASLVERSLTWRDQAGEPRFRMLETIRDYARETLEASGEAEAWRARHAAYFATVAEQADAKSVGGEQEEWVATLTAERDNCHAALSWYTGRGEGDKALGLAISLSRYWEMRGIFTEGRRRLREALAIAGSMSLLRARGLYCMAALSLAQGDFAEGGRLFEESLAEGRAAGDELFVANLLNGLGATTSAQGDHDRAVELFEESLEIRRRLGSARAVAATLGNLGLAVEYQGRLEAAARLYDESIRLNREIGNALGIAASLENLARLEMRRGNLGRATELVQESLGVSREMGDPAGKASCREIQGEVALETHDLSSAAEALGTRWCSGASSVTPTECWPRWNLWRMSLLSWIRASEPPSSGLPPERPASRQAAIRSTKCVVDKESRPRARNSMLLCGTPRGRGAAGWVWAKEYAMACKPNDPHADVIPSGREVRADYASEILLLRTGGTRRRS